MAHYNCNDSSGGGSSSSSGSLLTVGSYGPAFSHTPRTHIGTGTHATPRVNARTTGEKEFTRILAHAHGRARARVPMRIYILRVNVCVREYFWCKYKRKGWPYTYYTLLNLMCVYIYHALPNTRIRIHTDRCLTRIQCVTKYFDIYI